MAEKILEDKPSEPALAPPKQGMVLKIFKEELSKSVIKKMWNNEELDKKQLKQKVEQIRIKSME